MTVTVDSLHLLPDANNQNVTSKNCLAFKNLQRKTSERKVTQTLQLYSHVTGSVMIKTRKEKKKSKSNF